MCQRRFGFFQQLDQLSSGACDENHEWWWLETKVFDKESASTTSQWRNCRGVGNIDTVLLAQASDYGGAPGRLAMGSSYSVDSVGDNDCFNVENHQEEEEGCLTDSISSLGAARTLGK
mmetsp:Transcript_34048/g.82580  ORF Transcript_34048/g.82580 Transcript_34048/m.82580 type:complete len:118 (+) Transcript_34048:1393-1746(+)